MEPDFKETCKAIQPYFNDFANYFIEKLREGIFMGNEEDFTKAKIQIALLDRMKQTVTNETTEGV